VELPVCSATLGGLQIRAPQIANLRYGRVQLCATGLDAAKQTGEWEAEAYEEQSLPAHSIFAAGAMECGVIAGGARFASGWVDAN